MYAYPSEAKPNARRVGWELLATDYPYEHRMFRLRRDRLRLPDGTEQTFTYITKPPAVFVLPITPQGEMVLIRQFRYIADTWSWEIPAGGSHDFSGDDLAELARRELWEEAGARAEELRFLGTFHGATGVLSQQFHVYLALGVRLEADNHPETTEIIEVHTMPIAEAIRVMREGPADALDGYVVLKYEPLLRDLARQPAQRA